MHDIAKEIGYIVIYGWLLLEVDGKCIPTFFKQLPAKLTLNLNYVDKCYKYLATQMIVIFFMEEMSLIYIWNCVTR